MGTLTLQDLPVADRLKRLGFGYRPIHPNTPWCGQIIFRLNDNEEVARVSDVDGAIALCEAHEKSAALPPHQIDNRG